MKVIKYLSIFMTILVILVIPIKKEVNNEVTTYTSLSYRIIKTHKMNLNVPSGYVNNVEVYYFPKNFKNIEYFLEPDLPNINAYYNQNNVTMNRCGVNWNYYVGTEKVSVIYDSISPTEINYINGLIIKDFINIEGVFNNIDSIIIYDFNDKNIISDKLKYDNDKKGINVSSLKDGVYILYLRGVYDEGDIYYSLKFSIKK